MKIKNNQHIEYRLKPEKLIKYKEDEETPKHLTKIKKTKMYEYYKCDYCGEEIKITKKWEDRKGGIAIFPTTLTKYHEPLQLVLCNKCLNKAKAEFEEVS